MLTKEQVLDAVRGGRKSECIDGRDYGRLIRFFPITDWELFGFSPNPKMETFDPTFDPPIEWTRENILRELEHDTAFAFEKALNKRGISSLCMFAVVQMWCWILEENEFAHRYGDYHYEQYGLPLFKAVALKFGFPNPIGDDAGNEPKYASD